MAHDQRGQHLVARLATIMRVGAHAPRTRRRGALTLCVASLSVLVAACASPAPRPTPRPTSAPATPPASSPSPTVFADPTIALPPPNQIGHLRMFSASTGWAQRLDDGAVVRATRGVQRWAVASPKLSADQRITAVAYVSVDTAEALSAGSAAGQTTVDSWSTDNGGVTWIERSTFKILGSLPEDENGLDFVNAKDGWWSVGIDAPTEDSEMTGLVLYRTLDGGAHWNEIAWTDFADPGSGNIPADCQGQPPAAIFDFASFANATTGWITGQCDGVTAYVSVTRNGGAAWTVESLPASIPRADGPFTEPPQFVSPKDGALLASAPETGPNATLYVTSNGGLTWKARSTPGQDPQALDFINAADGWLLIANSADAGAAGLPDLWVTRNGGITWTSLLRSEVNNPEGSTPSVNIGGLGLDFLTTQVGWAAPAMVSSEEVSSPYDLMATTDGGRQWSAVHAQVTGSAPSLPPPAP